MLSQKRKQKPKYVNEASLRRARKKANLMPSAAIVVYVAISSPHASCRISFHIIYI